MSDEHQIVEEQYRSIAGVAFVRPETNEWGYMWTCLAAHFVNDGQPNPTVAYNDECNEVWQYMGTVRQGEKLYHEFRHRMHPRTGQRESVRLPASRRIAMLGDNVIEYR